VTGRKGEAALDWYSFAHLAGGGALGWLVPVGAARVLAVLVAYEVFEAALRHLPVRHQGKGLFEYESWPNIVADILVAWAGWAVVAFGLRGWPLPGI
jgi:hypothetical protein